MTELTLSDFLDCLASREPVPGGGSVAALVGALAAGLGAMVCHLTYGKKKYAAHEAELTAVQTRLDGLRAELTELVEADIEAYEGLSAAYQIPRDQAGREAAIQAALVAATETPLRIAEAAAAVIDTVPTVIEKGTRLAVSDAGMGALLGAAALQSAALNVLINLAATTDPTRATAARERLEAALGDRVTAAAALYQDVVRRIEA